MHHAVKIVSKIGNLEPITKLSEYEIADGNVQSLIEDGHVGCNLDEYAKEFEKKHDVSRPSSVDGLFALGNGDFAFVEFKDDRVLECVSPQVKFVHDKNRCYESWIQKKLYDSFIMLCVDNVVKIRDGKINCVAYIVIAAKKNGMKVSGISARMRQARANEIEIFKGLNKYLFRNIMLITPENFQQCIITRIDPESQQMQ